MCLPRYTTHDVGRHTGLPPTDKLNHFDPDRVGTKKEKVALASLI